MLAIDANIMLELFLEQDNYNACRKFLESVRDGKQAMISDFTISGIVLVLERYGKTWKDLQKFLQSLLNYTGLLIYMQTLQDKIDATRLMAECKLDFDDALTLQCALANNCSAIVSLDADFDRQNLLKRITPHPNTL